MAHPQRVAEIKQKARAYLQVRLAADGATSEHSAQLERRMPIAPTDLGRLDALLAMPWESSEAAVDALVPVVVAAGFTKAPRGKFEAAPRLVWFDAVTFNIQTMAIPLALRLAAQHSSAPDLLEFASALERAATPAETLPVLAALGTFVEAAEDDPEGSRTMGQDPARYAVTRAHVAATLKAYREAPHARMIDPNLWSTTP